MTQNSSYSFFNHFIERYLPNGFLGISREDPFIADMEKILEANNQFFFMADVIGLKILFTSRRSQDILGVDAANIDLSTLFRLTHPSDLSRKNLGRSKIFKMAQDLFIRKEGTGFISACFRSMNRAGTYSDLLYQGYMFFTLVPYDTVFIILVMTDITHMGFRKTNYHYYTGTDPGIFRYPDADLLHTGRLFSEREMEIVRLIAAGFDSRQIADMIFLSVNTVNTHRRNILHKSGKATTTDLIMDLKEMGLL
jgi:DNA-binding CsgD family transcriptional regulator